MKNLFYPLHISLKMDSLAKERKGAGYIPIKTVIIREIIIAKANDLELKI